MPSLRRCDCWDVRYVVRNPRAATVVIALWAGLVATPTGPAAVVVPAIMMVVTTAVAATALDDDDCEDEPKWSVSNIIIKLCC